MANREPKILFADIETSPNEGLFWRTGKQFIGHSQITEERQIIGISWKWLGKKKIYRVDWGRDACDKKILERFAPELEKADMLVGHNSDRFDWPWITGRMMFHKLPPLPKVKTLDTKKELYKVANLNSYALDYINKYFGGEGKKSIGYDVWKRLMKTNTAKDRKLMMDYCDRDIEALEEIYLFMRPYLNNGFNLSSFYNNPDICPKCGSAHIVKNGYHYKDVGRVLRYKCQDCNTTFTTGKSLVKNQVNYPR